MRLSAVRPRRPYDFETFGSAYLESDTDYLLNNCELAVKLLDREVRRRRLTHLIGADDRGKDSHGVR